MNGKRWLDQKPQTNKDWLLILGACILFYTVLGALDRLLGLAGQVLGILAPFAGGVVLAYVLDPFVRWMCAAVLRGKPRLRWVAILCAYLLLLLLVAVLVGLVLPQVWSSLATLFTSLPGYIANVQQALLGVQETYGLNLQPLVAVLDDYEQLMNDLYGMAAASVPEIVATLQAAASNVISVFTAVAGSIYMLSGKERLLRQLRAAVHALLPRPLAESTLRVCRLANENINGFFVGKVIDAAIVGGILFVAMSVLGIRFALLIAALMAVCNIIPVFGPFIGAAPSLVILLFVSPVQALEFLILVVVVQQVDSNVIAPKVLGRSLGISAFWVLFAVLLGANLFGVVGMVLGVPVFATLYGLIDAGVHWCLARRGIDEDGVRIAKPETAAEAAVHIVADEDAPAGEAAADTAEAAADTAEAAADTAEAAADTAEAAAGTAEAAAEADKTAAAADTTGETAKADAEAPSARGGRDR